MASHCGFRSLSWALDISCLFKRIKEYLKIKKICGYVILHYIDNLGMATPKKNMDFAHLIFRKVNGFRLSFIFGVACHAALLQLLGYPASARSGFPPVCQKSVFVFFA